MLNNLGRLGNQINAGLRPDEDGFVGRECPNSGCSGYFKIQFGTGLKGEGLPCHCPYCGMTDGHDKFFTQEQIEYATSVVLNRVTDALLKDLKGMEFETKPKGMFGIGLSLKVEGKSHPIRYYREKQLETEVVCHHCTLRYAIYGVFAFCPDCGIHNSLQILGKNLDLCLKEVDLAAQSEVALAEHLIGDALENAVSAFDGFGRETCRISSERLGDPTRAGKISFQNLTAARDKLMRSWGFDLSATLNPDEWQFVCRCFQKRHLLAHKMGVVDDAYLKDAGDVHATVGRKISITGQEVKALTEALRKLGEHLFNELQGLPKTSGRKT